MRVKQRIKRFLFTDAFSPPSPPFFSKTKSNLFMGNKDNRSEMVIYRIAGGEGGGGGDGKGGEGEGRGEKRRFSF